MRNAVLSVLLGIGCASPGYAQTLTSIAEAKYPAEQLLPGIEAKVDVLITINTVGVVESATVAGSSGYPPLDQAARDVAMTAKFSPALDKEGKPASVKARLPVSFAASPSPVERPCSGLNNEISEFLRFNPGASVDDVKSVNVLRGALTTGVLTGGGIGNMSHRIKNLKPVSEEILKQCSEDPKRVILDVVRSTAKKMNF
jgi:TonB family protein